MASARTLHPLLLEPTYWRRRLGALGARPAGLIWTPRRDLSGPGFDVLEFRARALDGTRLRGLFARSTWRNRPSRAVLRVVRPADRLEVDVDGVREGRPEFLLQECPGRPLADRVLDILGLLPSAAGAEGVEGIELDADGPGRGSDSVAIARQLLDEHPLQAGVTPER